MRIAITIILNGDHHLAHNDYGRKVAEMFDYWIIIEGPALPTGSTSWCNHPVCNCSTDMTISYIGRLCFKYENVFSKSNGHSAWLSKDEMVNAAINMINFYLKDKLDNENVFLWKLDIDEQWNVGQLNEAEKMLIEYNADCGCFHANHYVGENLIAKGTWGEGNQPEDPLANAYRRLWKWNGQYFKSHEPPILIKGNGKEILLPQRFNHYSYYFEKDVIFKSQYYKGYENLHNKWIQLQKEIAFPQPISRLIDGYWGTTSTTIDVAND
jgi:hypothetical protein